MKSTSAAGLTYGSLKGVVKNHREGITAGGPLPLVGGEFLFGDGEAIWCHRMKSYRNHTEMTTLKKVLEMDDEVPVVEEARVVPVSPTSAAKGLRLVWERDGVAAHMQRDSRSIVAA